MLIVTHNTYPLLLINNKTCLMSSGQLLRFEYGPSMTACYISNQISQLRCVIKHYITSANSIEVQYHLECDKHLL